MAVPQIGAAAGTLKVCPIELEKRPMSDPNNKLKQILLAPPWWLVRIVELLIPSNDRQGQKFLLERLWKKHPSVREVVPVLVPAIGDTIYVHAWSGFYWRMAAAQACVMLMVFVDVLSVRLIATLVVTFALLIVYEAYVRPKERLECEIITTLWVPALVIGLNLAAGLLPPHVVMPLDQLVPRAIVKLGVPIALARILFARDYDPNHPFRDLLDLHYRVWFYNFLWMALGVTYVMTLDQVVEAKSLQSFLVTAL